MWGRRKYERKEGKARETAGKRKVTKVSKFYSRPALSHVSGRNLSIVL